MLYTDHHDYLLFNEFFFSLCCVMLCRVMSCAGSAGTAVVTPNEALLFADGRYHNQAEMELGSSWTLMRQGEREG